MQHKTTALVHISNGLVCYLIDEFEDIILNTDLCEKHKDELIKLRDALNFHNSAYLNIEPPPFKDD